MVLLEIFISPGCWGCEIALDIARDLLSRAIPGIRIDVVDLSASGTEPPDHVMAVPTYCLDGKVISMGNPEQSELVTRLQSLSEHSSD